MTNERHTQVIRLSKHAPHVEVVVLGKRSLDNSSKPINLSSHVVDSRDNTQERHIDRSSHDIGGRSPDVLTFSLRLASGALGKFAVILLVPMMLIYPLLPAYAADESVASSSPITDATSTDTTPPPQTTVLSAVSDAVTSVIQMVTGSSTDTATVESTNTPAGDASTSPNDPIAASSTEPIALDATTTNTETASTTEGTASSTYAVISTTTESGVSSDASSTLSTASSTELTASSSEESIASSTDVVSTLITPPQKSAEEIAQQMMKEKEDQMRQSIRKEVESEFTKGCVSLDTTGYYCLKDKDSSAATTLAPSSIVTAVDSAPDSVSAYKQIFMTKGGVNSQLTHDAWDNAFPSTDISGKAVVWQGNISGRWQIFYADAATATPKAIQVTHSNESNFNPRVDGDDIVWQGWVDGNWEIFFAEHLEPAAYQSEDSLSPENKLLGVDRTWKVTRITTNSVHDMFPAVAGGLVTWQSFQDNAWNVYAYSVKTGVTSRLSQSGEKSEKPRFAITWDERSPEGAARMVGYDIASGKTIDLTNEARQVNDDQKPYHKPEAPISQPNQAALPGVTSSASSTSPKGDSDSSAGNDLGV